MQRKVIVPRDNWKDKAAECGFDFYQTIYETDCWNENACYTFTMSQIETIEDATKTLHDMCIETAIVISQSSYLMHRMNIPEMYHETIKKALSRHAVMNGAYSHLYGRFDFAYDGINPPKMLEYNADTPTALYETGVWQWLWLEDMNAKGGEQFDQFNSVHDKLIARWKEIVKPGKTVYFTCMNEFEEDRGTCRYLADTASQAGFETEIIPIDNIGMDENTLCDLTGNEITVLFKLYPWEWLASDTWGQNIPKLTTQWVEPIWKMLLSNKALLPILWERYPDHPNLLPSFFEDDVGQLEGTFVRKPFLSREGSNITIVKDKAVLQAVPGMYGKEGYIKQALATIPTFTDFDTKETKYTILGSWVIGDEPAGMIVRESTDLITNNWSQLVPHVITEN